MPPVRGANNGNNTSGDSSRPKCAVIKDSTWSQRSKVPTPMVDTNAFHNMSAEPVKLAIARRTQESSTCKFAVMGNFERAAITHSLGESSLSYAEKSGTLDMAGILTRIYYYIEESPAKFAIVVVQALIKSACACQAVPIYARMAAITSAF
eukprot:jgi/Botrbrau1/4543/Bobra.60_2s0031.1